MSFANVFSYVPKIIHKQYKIIEFNSDVKVQSKYSLWNYSFEFETKAMNDAEEEGKIHSVISFIDWLHAWCEGSWECFWKKFTLNLHSQISFSHEQATALIFIEIWDCSANYKKSNKHLMYYLISDFFLVIRVPVRYQIHMHMFVHLPLFYFICFNLFVSNRIPWTKNILFDWHEMLWYTSCWRFCKTWLCDFADSFSRLCQIFSVRLLSIFCLDTFWSR